jgi:hypothetical protein
LQGTPFSPLFDMFFDVYATFGTVDIFRLTESALWANHMMIIPYPVFADARERDCFPFRRVCSPRAKPNNVLFDKKSIGLSICNQANERERIEHHVDCKGKGGRGGVQSWQSH